MKSNPKRVLAVLAALLMVASMAAGGGLAATPSIDTETSNTAYESEIQQDTSLDGFDASADNESTVVLEGDNSTSPTFEITRNDSDTVVYENGSLENQTAGSWGTTWNGTLSHDELHDLERGINENVTLDLTAHDGNESNSTTSQFYINTTDDFTVENLDDVDADPDTDDAPVTTESLSETLTRISSFDIHTLEFSDLEVEDRAVNEDETDVVIVFSNGTVNDHAADAVPDDVSDEDAMYGFTLVVAGDDGPTQPIRVYHEEVPDDVDEDDDTYGVYHDGGIGGEDGVVINLGEEYDDEDEVSVTGRLNAGLIDQIQHRVATTGVWQSVFGALSFGDVLTGSVPTITFGAIAVRRRRLAG